MPLSSRALLIAVVVLLSGCSSAEMLAAGETGDPSRPAYVGVEPTPEGTDPSRLGMTISLSTDREQVRVGEVVTVTVVLSNTEREAVSYGPVCLEVTQGVGLVPPRSHDKGAAWVELARSSRILVPAPEACAPGPGDRVLAGGTSRTERLVWTAATANGAPYDGGVVLRVQTGASRPTVAAFPSSGQVLVQLSGGDPGRLSAMGALDRVLADPDVTTAIGGAPRHAAMVELVAPPLSEEPAWRVTLLRTRGTGMQVDVATGSGEVGPVGFTSASG